MEVIVDKDGNKWILDPDSVDPDGQPLLIPYEEDEE